MTWAQSNDDESSNSSNSVHKPATNCRPFVKWVGGKTQLLTEIFRRLPPKKTIAKYYEPFLGGGAVFFALQPKSAAISDVNPELINAFLVVKDSVGELIRDLKRHRHNEKYYYQLRNADRFPDFARWENVRRASRLIFLNKTCYNGLFRVNSKGQFNTPFGRYVNPNFIDVGNLIACSQVLSSAEISLEPFAAVLQRVHKGDFVYFDPPYAPVSETAYFTGYSKGGFDLQLQQQLFEVCCELNSRGIRFMLSNSAVPFIKKLYSRFNIDIVQATRAVNSRADKRGKVSEVLVTNYRI